jgi:hypothetical protein
LDLPGIHRWPTEEIGYAPHRRRCTDARGRRLADPWRECVLRLAMNDRLERLEMRSTYCFGGIGLLHCTPF